MPRETYLTQFICICEYCDAQTMATAVDRTITVSCGKWCESLQFPTASIATQHRFYDQRP